MNDNRLRLLGKLLCLSLLFLTGCWDRIEIEDRGFVVAIAIDKNEAEDELQPVRKGRHQLEFTQQIVIPSGMQQASGKGGSGGNGQKAYVNVTETGDSLLESTRNIASKVSRTPFHEHNRVIVISEELAETPEMVKNLLDVFVRDKEMRRGSKVFISTGKAKSILDLSSTIEKLPAKYLDSISQNIRRNSRMAPPTRVGDIQERMLNMESFAVQKIEKHQDDIKMAGLAVFRGKDASLSGYLDPEETEGRNLMTGDVQGGLLQVDYKDELVAVEFLNAKRKIKVEAAGPEQIRFHIHIQVTAIGTHLFEQMKTVDPVEIANLEAELTKEVLRLAGAAVEKSQHEFKTDVFGLAEQLKVENYRLWEQIKKDWDSGENYFSKSKINVTAAVKIQHFQNVRNTHLE